MSPPSLTAAIATYNGIELLPTGTKVEIATTDSRNQEVDKRGRSLLRKLCHDVSKKPGGRGPP